MAVCAIGRSVLDPTEYEIQRRLPWLGIFFAADCVELCSIAPCEHVRQTNLQGAKSVAQLCPL